MPEARTTYSRTLIMRKAWALARHNTRRFGGSVRAHFPAALRQTWAEVRQLSAETAAMLDRVLAEVAKIRAEARARRAAQEAATKAAAATAAGRTMMLRSRRGPKGPIVLRNRDGFMAQLAAAEVQARMAEAGARPTTAAEAAA
jgi:hypothetical protein